MEQNGSGRDRLTNLITERVQKVNGTVQPYILTNFTANIQNQYYIFKIERLPQDDTLNHLREAYLKLYEFQYLQNLKDALLILVLTEELSEELRWMQDFLENDRSIYLLWDGNNELYASPQTRQKLAFLWET